MEQYPSIDTQRHAGSVYVFDKLDGSNIRAEWSRKNGFTKFGTRTRLLDPQEPMLGEAVQLFLDTYGESLGRIFTKARLERATAFTEFHGPNSFAGLHEVEPHAVTLFDIHIYKRGLLAPRDFLKLVGDEVPTVNLLHEGAFTPDLERAVRLGELPGMTFEGIVAKATPDKQQRQVAFKLKSYPWLTKLAEKYGRDTEQYRRLM